jgi:hypothetical protein
MLTSKEIKDISNFFSHAVLISGLLLVFVTVFFQESGCVARKSLVPARIRRRGSPCQC